MPVWFSFTCKDGVTVLRGDSIIECEKVADSFRNNDIMRGFFPSVFCLVTEATRFFLSGDPQTDHCLPKQWRSL